MPLDIAQNAPRFTLLDANGERFALRDHIGSPIVLYFYPKDMTPGCTKQAEAFRDQNALFCKNKIKVIGISRDTVARHAKFAEKYSLNFTLLADEDGKVCEKYQVWQEKQMYGKSFMGIVRTTYIIDHKGKIAHVFGKVRVKDHIDRVTEALTDLDLLRMR